jgi:hypothetical protein
MGLITRVMGENENFMRAFPPVRGEFRVLNDLFEGIPAQSYS